MILDELAHGSSVIRVTTQNTAPPAVPAKGAALDLPNGVGCIGLRLQPETKSQRTRRADVLISYETLSGFQLGRWIHRLLSSTGLNLDTAAQDPHFLFAHADTRLPWTT